jgi:hypothetical protein
VAPATLPAGKKAPLRQILLVLSENPRCVTTNNAFLSSCLSEKRCFNPSQMPAYLLNNLPL